MECRTGGGGGDEYAIPNRGGTLLTGDRARCSLTVPLTQAKEGVVRALGLGAITLMAFDPMTFLSIQNQTRSLHRVAPLYR